MTFFLRAKDGRVHFSDLKRMAQSPAHARWHLEHPREPTVAMRLGSAVDAIVFQGKPVVRFEGRRVGEKWEMFVEDNPESIILTSDEFFSAVGSAEAVMLDPVAAPLLIGRHQVVAQWDAWGLPFASGIEGERGGFDILGDDFLADLKVTSSTEPNTWSRHAWKMLYPAQLACYQAGAPQAKMLHIIGVEAKPPHAVTVLSLSHHAIEVGRKMVASWCELVRQCESSGHWPGYVQRAEILEPLPWHETGGDDGEG